MPTVELTLYVDDDAQEWLIAHLTDLDFDGFLQEDDRLKAFIEAPQWDDVKRQSVEGWLHAHGFDAPLAERMVEQEDWNASWERSIEPLAVGPFLVRPTWTEPPPAPADHIELLIDPKMSFGTGYHESTRLVLRVLPRLVEAGDRVLDAGTGTGILAIAALKLGAASALTFDIDPWVEENALENFALNAVAHQATFRTGSLEVIEPDETDFDLVLANINRNALLALLSALAEKTRAGGHLVLAGLLQTDRDAVLAAADRLHLRPAHETTEGEWWSVVFTIPEARFDAPGAAPRDA